MLGLSCISYTPISTTIAAWRRPLSRDQAETCSTSPIVLAARGVRHGRVAMIRTHT